MSNTRSAVYISGCNKDNLFTIKRVNPVNCLVDELLTRVQGESRARRWLRLYRYLYERT